MVSSKVIKKSIFNDVCSFGETVVVKTFDRLSPDGRKCPSEAFGLVEDVFSVPSGIKYAAKPQSHCSEDALTRLMLLVECDGARARVCMCLASLIAPVQVDSGVVRAC